MKFHSILIANDFLKDYKCDVSKHLKREMMRFSSKLDTEMRGLHVYIV